MYPVPMTMAAEESNVKPSESGVPSSSNWKPTKALTKRIHAVAAMAAMWAALKPSLTLSGKGMPPTENISHISMTMKPSRNS